MIKWTVKAIQTLRPNAEWALTGTDILEWHSTDQTQPTWAEINDLAAQIEAEAPMKDFIKAFALAIQRYIDATAKSKDYGDGVLLASYDSSTNATWAAEAQTFIAWRDAVWTYAFGELEKVKSNQRSQPTIAALIEELPQIVW